MTNLEMLFHFTPVLAITTAVLINTAISSRRHHSRKATDADYLPDLGQTTP